MVVAQATRHSDDRGYLYESFRASEFRRNGLPDSFVQTNHSVSHRGVVRGLHYQKGPHEQGKLIQVVRGAIWDVAVDLRQGPTFGRWWARQLTSSDRTALYVPPGLAHGFLALEDDTELVYQITAEYHPESEAGLRWDDPDLAISWPWSKAPSVSARDSQLPLWREVFG